METKRSWETAVDSGTGSSKKLSHVESIQKCGYTIVKDLINPGQIAAYLDVVKTLWEEEYRAGGLHCQRSPHHNVNNLPARTRALDDLIANETLSEINTSVFGEHHSLNEFRALNLLRCTEIPFMHRDSMMSTLPTSPIRLYVILALEPFTKESGATFVVPGSNHFPFRPEPHLADLYERKVLEASPGSAIIFDANTWHGPSPNVSGASRWCLSMAFGHWFIKPRFDWLTKIGSEEFNGMSGRLKKLLGFNSRPPVDHLTRNETVLSCSDVKYTNA